MNIHTTKAQLLVMTMMTIALLGLSYLIMGQVAEVYFSTHYFGGRIELLETAIVLCTAIIFGLQSNILNMLLYKQGWTIGTLSVLASVFAATLAAVCLHYL